MSTLGLEGKSRLELTRSEWKVSDATKQSLSGKATTHYNYHMNINAKIDMSQGLSETQAQEKRAKEGFNELPSSKPRNLFAIALGMVREPMFLLLVACGTLYLILGDVQEGVMLLGFVFVIMGIELYQEKKTEKALDALKDLASPTSPGRSRWKRKENCRQRGGNR